MSAAPPEVDALIDKAVDLHTLPIVVFEAERLMRDPRTCAQQVADLIARDPVLATRVLRLVNSSFYGFQRRIGNLAQGIVILGFQTVKNLMLTVSAVESFRGDEDGPLAYPRFWSHSVACAIAAGEIARLAKTPHRNEAYVAGLLHDVGQLLVCQHLPELASVIDEMVRSGVPEIDAERHVLGRDHSDLGSMVAHAWSLPKSLTDAIRDHHTPREGVEAQPADVVHLADLVVSSLGIGRRRGDPLPVASPGLSVRLGYDESILAQWIERVAEKLERAQEFFEVVGAGPLRFC